jgi:hypothetical protein
VSGWVERVEAGDLAALATYLLGVDADARAAMLTGLVELHPEVPWTPEAMRAAERWNTAHTLAVLACVTVSTTRSRDCRTTAPTGHRSPLPLCQSAKPAPR